MKELNEVTKTLAALPPDIVSLVYVLAGFALAAFAIYATLFPRNERNDKR